MTTEQMPLPTLDPGTATEVSVDASMAQVLERLRRDAQFLARAFELPLARLEPEQSRVRKRLGICYADGRIKIRLHDARTAKPLKYSSLIDTLCHELAHLRYRNHSPRFRRLYRRILDYARQCQIYRPQKKFGARSVFDS